MLTTRNLNVEIGAARVCRDLSLRIQPGERWALLGRNGTGKTTLLHTLAGLRTPQGGDVLLDAVPLARLRRRAIARAMGLLPQASHDPFPTTVIDTVVTGRYPHRPFWRAESLDDVHIARNALIQVGLEHLEQRAVQTLSGGERRRLAIATVLAQQPRLYLLDEPTNHLDLPHQISTLAMFRSMATDLGCAFIAVLHDINLAYRFCEHVLMLYGDGETCCGETREVLTAANLHTLFAHPVVMVQTARGPAFLPD